MQSVPQRIQRQSRLRVRLRREVPSDVRRAVVHDDVVLHAVGRHALELRAAALRRDVVHERRASAYGFDGRQIHADDGGRHRHVLHGNLEPASGGGAQVHARARAAEEVILAVQLHELERRARPEALLFREVVELVWSGGGGRGGKESRRRRGRRRASARAAAARRRRRRRRRARASWGVGGGWGERRASRREDPRRGTRPRRERRGEASRRKAAARRSIDEKCSFSSNDGGARGGDDDDDATDDGRTEAMFPLGFLPHLGRTFAGATRALEREAGCVETSPRARGVVNGGARRVSVSQLRAYCTTGRGADARKGRATRRERSFFLGRRFF